MRKAIVIIDMPNSCEDCSLMWKDEYSDFCPVKCVENKTDIYNYTYAHTKPDWCPLKPVPEKYEMDTPHTRDWNGEYECGYNACIIQILGE